MKLVRDIKDSQAEIYSFTGDGAEERRVLSSFCERFNGKAKFLFFPNSPIRRGLKHTGLAALEALRHALIKYNLKRFLFLVDREHLRESGEVQRYLEEKWGAKVETVSTLSPERVFILGGSLSRRSFEVCVVIFGTTVNIEEDLSRLIEEVYGLQVESDKKNLNRLLRSKGKHVGDVINEASMEELERAFPGLCDALKWIESTLSSGT